jgi:hypothetical protein
MRSITRNAGRLPPIETERARIDEPSEFLEELIKKYALTDRDSHKPLIVTKQLSFFCEVKQPLGFTPGARFGSSFTKIGRRVYVFGGQCSDRKNDVKVLDTSAMRWFSLETKGDLPEERYGHSAAAYRSSILVFGGAGAYNPKLKIRTVFARISVLNTGQFYADTAVWDTIKPAGSPPDNRRFHCSSVVGATLYIYGGMAADGFPLGDLAALNLGEA